MSIARPMRGRAGWSLLSSRSRRKRITFYLFISPWLIGFVALGAIPLVLGLLTSLTNYDGMDLAHLKFVGLDNYARAFADSEATFTAGRTAVWIAINTPAWLVISFLLALILNQEVRGRGIFRTLYYLPSVIPAVAAMWVWKIFLNDNFGLMAAIADLIRPGTVIPWLTRYALVSVTFVSLWGGLGLGMVVFLAGLQGIPRELEEAAVIDGAHRIQVFRHVTIPLMTPVIFFQLVISLIGGFQTFVLPLLLLGGQRDLAYGSTPPRSIYLYMVYTYHQLFVYQRFGYGTALLWILFAVVLVLTLLVFWTQRYWVYYEVETQGEGR